MEQNNTSPSGTPPNPKKRRINVRVACQPCRSKKSAVSVLSSLYTCVQPKDQRKLRLIHSTVQCDGKRPVCTPCSKRASECTYMTDNIGDTPSMALKRQIQDLKKELNDQGVLLNHLKTLPEKEAVELLRRLQTTSDPSRYRPSQQVAARGILPPVQTDSEFELTVRHPMAYPALVPVNTASISLSPSSTPTVRRRITSSNEPTNSASLGLISSRKSVEKPPLAPLRADARSTSSVLGPLQARSYLDERLHGLSIGYWTRVPISDELAADIISFYLEVDHPSLGFFDADLFLGDLVGHQLRFCSAFLVSSLLFYACVSRAMTLFS